MMIAARNAFLMGRAVPTARDYVQDGLIALWDGIENAGWGTHDSTATTWVNLANNSNILVLQNGAHFDANSLVSAARNSVSALLSYRLGYVSIEVCAFRDTSRNSSDLVCFGNDANSERMMVCGANSIQALNGAHVVTIATSADTRTWAATYDGAYVTPYIDGAAATGTTTTNNWSLRSGPFGLSGSSNYSSYNFVGNYYCVRLYNRALTAAEVAANYAIDAARFEL